MEIANHHTMNDRETISRAMSLLGRRTSERKKRASRVNADKAWRARWKNHIPKAKRPKAKV